MARPADADSARTYEAILAAALEEVRDTQPRNAISLRKVAERASVSPGTIQYYFGNKAALLEACLDAYYERLAALGQQLLGELRPDSDTAELIERAVRSFLDFLRREQALVELRMVKNALEGELHPRRQDRFMGQVIGAAAMGLGPRVALSEVELRVAIQGLVSMLVRLAFLSEGERASLVGGDSSETAIDDHAVAAALRLLHPAG